MSTYIDSKYVKLISHRLRNFKQKATNVYQASCPFCGDSKKNLTKARLFIYERKNNLFVKCHNCGISTNAGNLIKQVDSSLYKEYILERYKAGESGNAKKPEFNLPSPKFGTVEMQKFFEHAEWCDKLPVGHFCLEYLNNRKVPKQFYNKLLFTSHYKQFVDVLIPNHGKQILDDARLIIPYYDKYNELIAVSGRALQTSDYKLRYVTVRTNNSEEKLVYGMNRININEPVKIVEGPIDSLFLNNCVASGDSNLNLIAEKIDANKKVLIFDNEPRNVQIVKMMQKAIKTEKNIVIWPNTIVNKDINEMIMSGISKDEIESIVSNNTFCGLEAQTKFIFWKKV